MKAEPFDHEALASLLKTPAGDYASIYLAPGVPGDALLQGPIYVKNAATGIETRLVDRGSRSTEVRDFVAPLRALAEDNPFWKAQGPGLGLFLSERGLHALRLHTAPANNWWLGDRYRVLPLLTGGEAQSAYFLLGVSANEVTFYRGSNDELHRVPVDGLPHNLTETLQLDQKTALVQVMNTPVGATFHGQGAAVDHRKDELREYFRRIDRALHSHLAGASLPLVFAGVDYLFPIFREVCTYPHLIDRCAAGNPERSGMEVLRRRTVEALGPLGRQTFERDLTRYEDAAGARRTTEFLSAVLSDAHRGVVDVLIAAEGGTIWGRFDPTAETMAITNWEDPIGCDLYDLAAFQTLLHGGRVHVVPATEVPHGGTIAALLRYAPPVTV